MSYSVAVACSAFVMAAGLAAFCFMLVLDEMAWRRRERDFARMCGADIPLDWVRWYWGPDPYRPVPGRTLGLAFWPRRDAEPGEVGWHVHLSLSVWIEIKIVGWVIGAWRQWHDSSAWTGRGSDVPRASCIAQISRRPRIRARLELFQ